MSLVETESVVIKSYNLAEADKIVVLLTREHGVVRAVAKGAKRLKSRFGSSLEIFSLIRAEYFEKDTQELVSLQKAELVRSSFEVASQPEFLQRFSYLSDLIVAFSPPNDPNEVLFRALRSCLAAGSAPGVDLSALSVYFELWLLKIAGFMPDWSQCDSCGGPFADGENVEVRMDLHLVCPKCSRAGGRTDLDPAARDLASSAWRLPPEVFAASKQDQAAAIEQVAGLTTRLIAQAAGREGVGERTRAVTLTLTK